MLENLSHGNQSSIPKTHLSDTYHIQIHDINKDEQKEMIFYDIQGSPNWVNFEPTKIKTFVQVPN